jgi:molybdopterin/thiamine biosynthesis adenylyltransferase
MDASNPVIRVPEAPPELTAEERATADWQLPVSGFGEAGQRRLKGASVLISRVGGLGGMVALHLAAAGVGRLILAHGGNVKPSDLNRQLLMSHASLGTPRIDAAVARLKALNPRLEIIAEPANITEANAARLVAQADLVMDCAPLFAERYLLNREAVAQRKPMVEAAVYELEFHLTLIVPGQTPCLRCLYPEPSTTWTRRFPVFGAVAGVAGSMAAMEAIKQLARLGTGLQGRLFTMDLRNQQVTNLRIRRLPGCPDCGTL